MVIERLLNRQWKLTELSLKCACHSAHFSHLKVTENRTEMCFFFLWLPRKGNSESEKKFQWLSNTIFILIGNISSTLFLVKGFDFSFPSRYFRMGAGSSTVFKKLTAWNTNAPCVMMTYAKIFRFKIDHHILNTLILLA